MTRRRPPIDYATDHTMMRLSAVIRERRNRRLTAYDVDPGLQQASKVVRREALERIADDLDLPQAVRDMVRHDAT